jgi:hypothetical protein
MADFYGGSDLTYEYTGGSIMAGGYKIESLSLMNQFNGGGRGCDDGKDNGNNGNYMIPIGLINFNIKNKNTFNILNSSDILSHDLYDNILNLVNIDPKPLHNITKKNRSLCKSKSQKVKK